MKNLFETIWLLKLYVHFKITILSFCLTTLLQFNLKSITFFTIIFEYLQMILNYTDECIFWTKIAFTTKYSQLPNYFKTK